MVAGESEFARDARNGKTLAPGLRVSRPHRRRRPARPPICLPYPGLWLHHPLSLAFTIVSLVPAYLPRPLIDEGLEKGDWNVVKLMVLLLVLAHGAANLLSGARGYYLQMLGQKVLFDIRRELYIHLQTLSSSFYDKRQTGAIMARVIGDVNQLSNLSPLDSRMSSSKC